MPKKRTNKVNLPTDNTGQLIDPFTGELLVSIDNLEEAAKYIAKTIGEEETDRIPYSKLEGYISSSEIAKELKIDAGNAGRLFRKFKEQIRKSPGSSIQYLTLEVPLFAFKEYRHKGEHALTVRKDWAQKIVEEYHKSKGNGLITASELAEMLEAPHTSARRIVDNLGVQADTEPETPLHYIGITLPCAAICRYRSNGVDMMGLTEEAAKQIAAEYKRSKKDKGFLTGIEFAERLGVSETRGLAIIAEFKTQILNQPKKNYVEYLGLEIPRTAFSEYSVTENKKALSISEVWAEKVKEVFGKPKTDDDIVSGTELGEILNVSRSGGALILSRLKEQLLHADTVHYRGIEIPQEALTEYRYGQKLVCGIYRKWAERLAAASQENNIDGGKDLENSHTDGIGKKSIKPGSKHLERTDRVRGKSSDENFSGHK